MDKESLVKFNGFLAPKAEGSYLILNEGSYQIEGQTDTWKVIDEKNVQEQRFVQLVCEQTKKQKPDIVLHDSGVLVAQTIYGFDSSIMKKIEKFLREQKPELLHHQKFLENGTAERAKESGTEQNYNMIDGCVNNNPKKPRIIGNRISVLDRLHIKLEERKQKSQPQQQQPCKGVRFQVLLRSSCFIPCCRIQHRTIFYIALVCIFHIAVDMI